MIDGRISRLDGFNHDAVPSVVPEAVGLGRDRDAPPNRSSEAHAPRTGLDVGCPTRGTARRTAPRRPRRHANGNPANGRQPR